MLITASIGVAYGGGTGTGPAELIHEAEMAMYRVKRPSPLFPAQRRLHLAD